MAVKKYKAGQIYDYSRNGTTRIWLRYALCVQVNAYTLQRIDPYHLASNGNSTVCYYRMSIGYGATFSRISDKHPVSKSSNEWAYYDSSCDRTRVLVKESKALNRFNSAFEMLIFKR